MRLNSRLKASLTVAIAAVFMLTACQVGTFVHPPTGPLGVGEPTATSPQVPLTISGHVRFPASAGRSAQATIGDIATAATVSLIDTGANQTVATTVTNSSGQFNLSFPTSFHPSPTATYYLEAVKGLNNNVPGNSAARVRTLIRFNAGWVSLTGSIPGSPIYIDSSTTALSIGAALKNGNPSPIDFSTFIGTLTLEATQDDYVVPVVAPGYGTVTTSDYTSLVSLVSNLIQANLDPVGNVAYNSGNGTWNQVIAGGSPSISALSPTSGPVGTTVTITGTGFSTTASSNTVRFNGSPATVTTASATSLTVTVPAGATSGGMTIQVGSTVCLGPNFTVPVTVSGFSPTSGGSGTSVTITGTGFDGSVLANNAVSFNGASATVTSATATSLIATVPGGATSGPITVTVAGVSTTSSSRFTVPVTVSSFSPTAGMAGTSVTITGTGFSSTLANNTVTFNGTVATVNAASPTSLAVTVPSGGSSGPVSVNVGGTSASSAGNFTYASPFLGALYQALSSSGNTLLLDGNFGQTATVNFPGGVSTAATLLGSHRAQITIPSGAMAGNLSVTTNGVTTNSLPFTSATYGLGLSSTAYPSLSYGQAAYAQQDPTLLTARQGLTSTVVGNYLYVIGGYDGSTYYSSVDRAVINADGSLGPFQTVASLNTGRTGHTAVAVGNYLYVMGGQASSGYVTSVERAPLNADGSLSGGFTDLASGGVSLTTARFGASSVVIGNTLFVLGGYTSGTTATGTIEQATIASDGSLGAFAASGVSLQNAREGHTCAVIGSNVYVIGGAAGGTPLSSATSVEVSAISGNGTLGTFSVYTNGLSSASGVYNHATAVVGNTLYVLGGQVAAGGNAVSTIEQATITGSTLGTFSNAAATLNTARCQHSSIVIGRNLYDLGGSLNGSSSFYGTVERLSVNSSGGLSAFANSPTTLAAATYMPGVITTPGRVYLIGGLDNANSVYLTTIQMATVNLDGTLSPFKAVGNLNHARRWPMVVRAGNYVYVIGGDDSASNRTDIEKAAVNPDGTLGSFSETSYTTPIAHWGGGVAVSGSTLFVLGGIDAAMNPEIDSAPLDSSGNLTANFSNTGWKIPYSLNSFSQAMVGNTLYMFGGLDGSSIVSTNVQSVTFNNGTITATASAGTLSATRELMGATAIGSKLYLVGGYSGGGQLTLMAGSIAANGSIGSWTTTGTPNLSSVRWGAACIVLGNRLYYMGGKAVAGSGSGAPSLSTIDAATLN